MARLLAIDWDNREARYVIGATRGSHVNIEAAGAIALPDSAGPGGTESELSSQLRAVLAGKAARATTVVGVDRSRIELVSMTLPPASDVELPDMVRNQAMRDNSAIAEDDVLDFVTSDADESGPRAITAVALSRSRLEKIQTIASEAGLAPKSIVVRPYATAGLVLDALENRDQACLVINVLSEEVDLIVLAGGRVVFWRTVRQSGVSRDEAAASRLVAEVQRTLLVAQSRVPGQTAEAVYLCGGLDEHPALAAALRERLPLELVLTDPFAAYAGLDEPPEHPGRFASLVGMLVREIDGGHPIDFLNPRQAPAPADRRRVVSLAAAVVVLLLAMGGYRVWSTFAESDDQIETLTAQLDRLDELVKRNTSKAPTIPLIENWSKDDVNWLDELRDLSIRFPSERDAVVLRMNMSQGRESGGSIDMTGIVRDPVIVSHIENGIRDKYHQISSRHMQEQLQENNYSWHFESSIVVTPREPDQYVSHLPESERPVEPPEAETAPLPKALRERAARNLR